MVSMPVILEEVKSTNSSRNKRGKMKYDALELTTSPRSERFFHLYSDLMHHLREIYNIKTVQNINDAVAEVERNKNIGVIWIDGILTEKSSPFDIIAAGARLRMKSYNGLMIVSCENSDEENEFFGRLLNAGCDEDNLSWVYDPTKSEKPKTHLLIPMLINYAARHKHLEK